MRMADIPFNDAMVFFDSCLVENKRELNKLLRDYCIRRFNKKLSVKNADVYVSSYKEILELLYDLAVENWHSSEQTDFDQYVYSNYPAIDEKLKNKWVQNAHFKVFR